MKIIRRRLELLDLDLSFYQRHMTFPPDISPQEEAELVHEIKEWSFSNGLVMVPVDNGNWSRVVHAPVTLYPTIFPKIAFQRAINIQELYNRIYISVTLNTDWLVSQLEKVSAVDDFTGKLYESYNKVKQAGITQPLTGGLFRSDYIVHEDETIKQVEFNTVSVSFGALSSRTSRLHRFLHSDGRFGITGGEDIPESPAEHHLASGLHKIHEAYGNKDAVVLFVVQPKERNSIDQRAIEYQLFEEYGLRSLRLTLTEAQEKLEFFDGTKLRTKNKHEEISVVYYRSGYGPGDYPSDTEWASRIFLEQSHAIKVPSLLTQLAGAKKVQQVLAQKDKAGIPEDLKGPIDLVQDTFVPIYPLDDSEAGLIGRKEALTNSQYYVLKPQREGGGNNIYREDIPKFLEELPEDKWSGYILMRLINPVDVTNKIVRDGEVYTGQVVSELGVFGSALWNTNTGKVLLNTNSGWLLRTKLRESDEGGVAAGFGCIDAVYLQ